MSDANFGEMFHNFPKPDTIRKHSGVDISIIKDSIKIPGYNPNSRCIVHWNCPFMGMKSSPYNAVSHYYLGE